jgi:hypothetical protein
MVKSLMQKRYTVTSNKFWSSMSFQNFVRLSQNKKYSLPDYAQQSVISYFFSIIIMPNEPNDPVIKIIPVKYSTG